MRVMVLGAGMIGAHAAVELMRKGAEVTTVDIDPSAAYYERVGGRAGDLARGDIGDGGLLHSLLSAAPYDAVVLAAGPAESQTEAAGHAALEFHATAPGEVAGIAARHGVRCFVLVSSLAVYEDLNQPLAAESAELDPGGAYARAKLAGERAAAAFSDRLCVKVLRPCGVYGAFRSGTCSSSARLAQTLLRDAVATGVITLNPDLQTADEWIYVKDLAEAIRRSAMSEPSVTGFSVLNAGTGGKVPPAALADAVQRVVPGTRVVFSKSGLGQARFTPPLDVMRIRNELGFQPAFDLQRGLADLLEQNYDDAKS